MTGMIKQMKMDRNIFVNSGLLRSIFRMEVIWIQYPFACNFQSHYKLAVRKMQSLFFDPSANIHLAYPLVEKKISTAEGILLRVNRSIQAEGVFAAIKEDLNFRRFLARGNANVTVEWYLVSMAYNILKLHHKIQTGRLGNHLFVPGAA